MLAIALVLITAGTQALAPPRLRATPDIAFKPSADLQLSDVTALHFARRGEILLVDRSQQAVLRLDSLGRTLPPLARAGDGPGEVRRAFALGWLGDTLWVADAILRRLTYYSADLKFLRTQPDQDRCGASPMALVLGNRCLVLRDHARPPTEDDPPAFPMVLTTGSPPLVLDTIGLLAAERLRMRIRYADAEVQLRQPFSDVPLLAVDQDGRGLAWIDRQPDPGHPTSFTITWIDGQTRVRHTVHAPFVPVPLPKTAIDSALTHGPRLGRLPPTVSDSVPRHLYRPQNRPAVLVGLFDDRHRLWLRVPDATTTTESTWRVVDRAGREVTSVLLPRPFRPFAIRGHRLLGTALDDDDVPMLLQYRVDGLERRSQ